MNLSSLSRANLYKNLKKEIKDSFIQDYVDGVYNPIYNQIVSIVDNNLDKLDDFDIITDLSKEEIRKVLVLKLSGDLDEDEILSKINYNDLY